jgi:hypothetical protein
VCLCICVIICLLVHLGWFVRLFVVFANPYHESHFHKPP